MNLLLLSSGMGAVPSFLTRSTHGVPRRLRLGYVTDAATQYAGAPFVEDERSEVAALGHDVVDIRLAGMDTADLAAVLDGLDAVYVAGGSTFALLAAMRSRGADRLLVERVRAGLPYIGASAGSIVAGPSIEPASLMDDPADAPDLHDHTGLHLVDEVVIPHADGRLPPYPPELIERTLATYGSSHRLVALRDDQALLVDDGGSRVVDSPDRDG